MSAPLFTVEPQTPRGFKYGLAMRILGEVAPAILSVNTPVSQRVAVAYTWYLYLKKAATTLCADVCGPEFPEDYQEWGDRELEKIAEALAEYASELLREVMTGSSAGGIRAPRPPV